MARRESREQYDIYMTGSNNHGQLFPRETGSNISTFRLRFADQPPPAYRSFDILYVDSNTTVTLVDDVIASEGRQRHCARMFTKPILGTACGHPDVGMLGFVDERSQLNLVRPYPLPGQMGENWDVTPAAPYGLERNAVFVTSVLRPESPKLGLVAMSPNGSVVCTIEHREHESAELNDGGTGDVGRYILLFESCAKFTTWHAQGDEPSEDQPTGRWTFCGEPLQLVAFDRHFLLLLDIGIVHVPDADDHDSQTIQSQGDASKAQLPRTMSGLESVLVEKIAAGSRYGAAISRQGKLYLWDSRGADHDDHLACLEMAQPSVAMLVPVHDSNHRLVPGILDIAVGSSHIAIVTTDHRLFAIGSNDHGQLGLLNDQQQRFHLDWIEIKQPKNVHRVICALDATVAFATPKSVPSSDYDEDEIFKLMTSIYLTAIRMGMFEDHEVTFAPPQGHEIDLSQLEHHADLDPRCVSLMRKLPYAPAGYRCVIYEMESVDYRSAEIIRETKYIDHPVMLTPGPEKTEGLQWKARPVDMFLLHSSEGDDPSLVLDVENSKSLATISGTTDLD
ncbi:hypothetical protein LTR78_000464 [Recurvomyces mirabilis]|uniref:Uncharacterized protein n=1 Tax=Recurvomyces mirabilis TaxID=574656 RepID=A0AAE1C6M1_9PEZI|nr:hypothetical protein LTR78_000464 [Recurvomyces mirabilis]KAK5162119.1 hypothetical protein LTS14_000465 [Recurvomyces mirabilis]